MVRMMSGHRSLAPPSSAAAGRTRAGAPAHGGGAAAGAPAASPPGAVRPPPPPLQPSSTACLCPRTAPHRPAHAHGLKASSTAVRHAAAALHPPRPAPAACQLPRLLVCRSHSCAGGWLAPQVWPPACHHCADCRHAQHLPALLLVCSSSRQRCRQAASDGGPANFVRIAVQRRFLSLAALFCCPHGLPASTH